MSISETTNIVVNENNGLILNSLDVKNFRAFRHLSIGKLGRVNLITGKNNVGKSSLLEALWLLSQRGSLQSIRSLLIDRDDFRIKPRLSRTEYDDTGEGEIEGGITDSSRFLTLFHGRPYDVDILESLEVSANETNLPILQIHVALQGSYNNTSGGQLSFDEGSPLPDVFEVSLIVTNDYSERLEYSPEELQGLSSSSINRSYGSRSRQELVRAIFIHPAGLTNTSVSRLWDRVSLTPFEDEVVKTLHVIAPGVERISFIGERGSVRGRTPFLRTVDKPKPIPMRSLGDGTNRLFALSLALVSLKGGLLLVDEIENGLHFSVLFDVWRLIFQTARRLNVQVFATTHSWDCIEAFQQAAAEDDDPSSGVLVRLQNDDGDVTSTVFDERRLAVVTRQGIEVR